MERAPTWLPAPGGTAGDRPMHGDGLHPQHGGELKDYFERMAAG